MDTIAQQSSGPWEYGSEFHWLARGRDVATDCTPPQHPWAARGRFFGCGRDALRVLAEYGRRARGWRRMWIPAYFCPEVTAAILSTGLEGAVYRDGPDGDAAARLDLPFAHGDVLLLVNHFGLRKAPALAAVDRSRVEIVEDHTHDPWSPWAWSSVADFALVSLRKTLPLPDGAVLWSPRGGPLPDEPPLSAARRRAAERKRAGMVLKADYLRGREVSKEEFRALLLDGEREIAAGDPSAMTAESRALLDGFPVASWRATRRENHRYLSALLTDAPGMRVLAAADTDGCPFSAVLSFDAPQRCAAVRRRLIEERIYPAVLWPQESGRDGRAPLEYRRLSARLLSLHCDMRYGRADLARAAAAVLRANECLVRKTRQPVPCVGQIADLPEQRPAGDLPHVLPFPGRRRKTALQAFLIAPASPRWEECLAEMPHDFYHLPQYARIAARQEGGEPLAFVAEEDGRRMLLPLIVRPVMIGGEPQSGWFDATSPYGYPCPALSAARGQGDAAFLDRALESLRGVLRERRIVGAFVRMHPLLPLPQGPFADRGRLVQHGETVWIDLTLSAEELWRQTRPGHRNEIGRARRSGAVVEIEGTWRHLDDFQRAYTATMHRVGASHYYFFPRDYFHALRDRMPGVFHLCVVRVGDEFACGGLFSEVGGIVQYHLSASRTEFAKHFPSKLMLDFVRGWAKERGNRALHLGGGLGSANDSLLLFKAGFSHLRTPFHTWRAIADEQAYESLRERWQRRAGTDADALDGFFPAYRKPLPEPRRAVA